MAYDYTCNHDCQTCGDPYGVSHKVHHYESRDSCIDFKYVDCETCKSMRAKLGEETVDWVATMIDNKIKAIKLTLGR